MSTEAVKKQKMLDRVADESGVAVVVLDENSREVSVSNNNSICRALTASPEFAPKCAAFCGMAFRNTASGDTFEYECHAGLICKAVPVTDHGKRFVAIVGRTFMAAEKYRQATDRAISGDWADFPPNDFFENVLMTSSVANIDKAVAELSKFRVAAADDVLDLDPSKETEPRKSAEPVKLHPAAEQINQQVEKLNESVQSQTETLKRSVQQDRRTAEAAKLRTLYGELSKLKYNEACLAALEFLTVGLDLESLVWLERKDNRFITTAATGTLREIPIKIGIPADNERLVAASQQERALELRERIIEDEGRIGRTLSLFATLVGGDIRSAIGVEGHVDEAKARDIALFCRRVAPQIEILHLRREVSDREWLNRAVTRFNESLKRIDAEDFWTHVTQVSAELVQSERASLLVRDEQSENLYTKAAIGAQIDLFGALGVGDAVSKLVLDEGDPVVVEDIRRIGIKPAPADWRYKTQSFLSYPILIGERRIGVMNFTDKAGGLAFDQRDLELLHAIAPQIAVAIDRTVLKSRAGELEQLSVTDSLTGLLNRRYLDKRLIEEIQRSKRHRFPMSLMMLDIDNFKSYNDTFGHQAGDAALKIVANVLQDILRGADVAARYGGEEFAILLPQTTSNEAAAIAERLRQRIEHTEFSKRKITVSIGIAACSNEIDTPDDIIGAADYALYDAKNNGRNNVQVYDGFGKSFNQKIN